MSDWMGNQQRPMPPQSLAQAAAALRALREQAVLTARPVVDQFQRNGPLGVVAPGVADRWNARGTVGNPWEALRLLMEGSQWSNPNSPSIAMAVPMRTPRSSVARDMGYDLEAPTPTVDRLDGTALDLRGMKTLKDWHRVYGDTRGHGDEMASEAFQDAVRFFQGKTGYSESSRLPTGVQEWLAKDIERRAKWYQDNWDHSSETGARSPDPVSVGR